MSKSAIIKIRTVLWVITAGLLLFFVSYLLEYFLKNEYSLQHQASLVEKQIAESEQDFNELLKDTVLTTRLIQGSQTVEDMDMLHNKPYYFSLHRKLGGTEFIRYWNDNFVLPDSSLISSQDTQKFIRLANGYYYAIKKTVPNNDNLSAYCLILIKHDFFVETSYLSNTFYINKFLSQKATISDLPTDVSVTSPNGKDKMYFKLKPKAKEVRGGALIIVLRIVGLFLLCYTLQLFLVMLLKKRIRNTFGEVIILAIFFVLFRIILSVFADALQLDKLVLFDMDLTVYDRFNATVGDILINTILWFWVALKTYEVADRIFIVRKNVAMQYSLLMKALATIIIVIGTFLLVEFVRNFIFFSGISFDVTNSYGINVITLVGFFIIGLIVANYYLLSRILFKILFNTLDVKLYELYIIAVSVGLGIITFIIPPDYVLLYLVAVLWLIVFVSAVYYEKRIEPFINFNVSRRVRWVALFAIGIAMLVVYCVQQHEMVLRRGYVEGLAKKHDRPVENIINGTVKKFNDYFLKKNIAGLENPLTHDLIVDSIASSGNSAYTDRFVTELYIYDSLGRSIYNPKNISFEALSDILRRQARPTNSENLYYYEQHDNAYAYITQLDLVDSVYNFNGNVFIISNAIKTPIQQLAPELFLQFNDQHGANAVLYQYAVYNHNSLKTVTAQYPFSTTLVSSQLPQSRYEVRDVDGYRELWYKPNADEVIVMARKDDAVLQVFTVFSYFFCLFFLLVLVVEVLSVLLSILTNDDRKIPTIFGQTIRKQVYVTFIIISILSFVVIGVATIQFYINGFEEYNKERLTRIMRSVRNELKKEITDVSNRSTDAQDSINKKLEASLKRVSAIHGIDVNVYDLTGKLGASSQSEFYKKGVVSNQIDPRAFFNLQKLRYAQYIQNEQISNLSFTNIYSPVISDNGVLQRYLSIPYFSSQQDLNQRISDILITLLNLYAFVFLITSLISIFITNRITHSLSLVGEKMRSINFSKQNKPIVWKRNDEIGKLVEEYNRMLSKLQDSATSLAKAERELAWREMARQVAHEIKNPLTPMKLSLQYLQKAIDENRPNVAALTANVSKTLVEQMDHLAHIASEFSQFANISRAKKEAIDLHQVITPINEIYTKQPNVLFTWYPVKEKIFIYGDPTHLNRLLTNLIVNAIEASDKPTCIIDLREHMDDGYVFLTIVDNGKGIAPEMHEKLFTPNFTTKSSGTGLGLAMCRSIVEQMNGAIWFDTVISEGTKIYVKIPMIDPLDYE